mmetsp:Transcript_59717/g.182406  ORF Transcript_59717/g.182406 Transcript_59717/m.182406 type:complete len:354 (-) Transcript_59717:150-1211(-)
MPVPRRDDETGQAYREDDLGERPGQHLDRLCDLRHGDVEGLLPGDADEDADGIHDGPDGLVKLRVEVLEILDLLKEEDQEERHDGDRQRESHLLHHALLLVEELVRQEPVGAEEHAPGERHRHDVLHLRVQPPKRDLRVDHAEAFENRQDHAQDEEAHRLELRVAGLVGAGLLALGIRQVAADDEADGLHEAEGHRQAGYVVLGLLGLVVPQLLVRVLRVVVQQDHALPRRVRGPPHGIDEHPRHRRHQEGRHEVAGHLLLQHGEGVDGREACDVPQQDREGLEPALHDRKVLLVRVEPLDRQHAAYDGQHDLQRNEPQEHVHEADDQLLGLPSAFEDVGLHEAVETLEDQDR